MTPHCVWKGVHVESSSQRRADQCLCVAVKCNKNSSLVFEALSRTINSETLAGQRWPHGKSGNSVGLLSLRRSTSRHRPVASITPVHNYNIYERSLSQWDQSWQTRYGLRARCNRTGRRSVWICGFALWGLNQQPAAEEVLRSFTNKSPAFKLTKNISRYIVIWIS